MEKRLLTILVLLGALVILFNQCVYTVHETERAIVLQLGSPVKSNVPPGLHFKIPFIQNVIYLDARILTYDSNPAEALTSDNKTIVLDNYARWRITEPLLFYQTLRTVRLAQARLVDIVYSELRVVVGRYTLEEVVSSKRQEIMRQVIAKANELSKTEYGVEVIDVRIKRTDLPQENQRAIFGRMQAERERQAKQYRSQGEEEARKIRSGADREVTIMLAEARRKAEVLHGEGDAEAIRIFAEALNKSPEFYEFYRSLEAYKKGLKDNGRIILQPGQDFLRFFQ
ncbi:MAG: protease modulator HflC [Deltaproteobacteria bacterium]|jgi:membrane protease subunit HflC|nr:protease modulator HflC [Deltaproteobacteria bacterium]